MLISMFAWVLRFGLFSFGDPTGGLWMIVLSCIVYGMAFDFFNISGSLFVETSTTSRIRSSAQGLFMMMTNGFGAVFGSFTSGWIIDHYFTKSFQSGQDLAQYLDTNINDTHFQNFLKEKSIALLPDGTLNNTIMLKDWHDIWLAFAIYTLVIAVLFALFFRHKHEPESLNSK